MEERRKYQRYSSKLSVIVKLEDATYAKGVAQSQNLSREGMKFTTNIHIPVNKLIRLEITSSDGAETVRAKAKVIWGQKTRHSEHDIEYGVNFLEIDPIEKFHLLEKTFDDEMNK